MPSMVGKHFGSAPAIHGFAPLSGFLLVITDAASGQILMKFLTEINSSSVGARPKFLPFPPARHDNH